MFHYFISCIINYKQKVEKERETPKLTINRMIESISTFQSFVEAINICDILESFEILKKSAPQGEELSTFGFLKGLDYHVANELYKLLGISRSNDII